MRLAHQRLTPTALVARMINLCFADPRRADPRMVEAAASLALERRTGTRTEAWFLQAARSLLRVQLRPNLYRRMLADLQMPVLVVHGEKDRLVPIASARIAAAAAPNWDATLLPGVGHTPQLEVPDLVISAITDWLARPALLARSTGAQPRA